MKGALIAGLIAIAFGAASSAPALAQAKKEASPGAVVSASKPAVLPSARSAIQGSGTQSAAASSNKTLMGEAGTSDTGLVTPNSKMSENARTN